jgi:cyclohexanecarboxyl-CoA dehydrogenase
MGKRNNYSASYSPGKKELHHKLPSIWTEMDDSEEEQIFRESIRRFVEDVINPNEFEAKKDYNSCCKKIRLEAGKRGILGLPIPQEFGGQGAPAILQGIAYEEIGRSKVIGYGLPWPLIATYTNFATGCKDYIVKKWMPRYLSGESELGIGSTEPKSGSDVATIITTATKQGDGYVLRGEKGPVSSSTRCDSWVILARTGAPESGARGITEFFVEDDVSGLDKYHFDSMEESADLGGFRLNEVKIEVDHIIGEENKGFYRQMDAFDLERVLIPMEYLGAAMDSVEVAIEFTKNRVVWGKPIAAFEGVMFPLVEGLTKLQTVRSFCYKILRQYDKKKRITMEASMLRWYLTRVALDVLDTCIQVSGAAGYSDNLPHQRRYRWVRAGLFGHGSQEIQKLVIAREVMGKEIYKMALGRT